MCWTKSLVDKIASNLHKKTCLQNVAKNSILATNQIQKAKENRRQHTAQKPNTFQFLRDDPMLPRKRSSRIRHIQAIEERTALEGGQVKKMSSSLSTS